jgi:hypothetical protein
MLRTPPHPAEQADRTERLLAAVRMALVAALTALVLAIAALAHVVSLEAIRAFAVETAAFPPALAWSAPLLVDSFHHRGQPGHLVAVSARGGLARALVCLDAGWLCHRRERGPHRPAAHPPHPDRGGPQWRPRGVRDGGRPAAAARTRPQPGCRQRQRPAARQPHSGAGSWSLASAPPASAWRPARWRPRPGSASAAPMSYSARYGQGANAMIRWRCLGLPGRPGAGPAGPAKVRLSSFIEMNLIYDAGRSFESNRENRLRRPGQ